MANIYEPTDQQKSAWTEWVKSRPEGVRKVAEKFYPWKLYKLNTSGHRVTLNSIDEPVEGPPTLKVNVSGDYNLVAFERTVFGIAPEDLEECDLPEPNEFLGSIDMPIEDAKKILGKFVVRKDRISPCDL